MRELAERRAELEADVAALSTYVRDHRARLADELRGQLEWLKAPGRLALPEPPVPMTPPESEGAPMAAAPEPEDEVVDLREESSGPVPLPGADDDGGPPTQGMPIDLTALEADEEGEDAPPPMVNRTIDVREVRSAHAALDTAAEGDPFLTELRRAVVDDDGAAGGGTALEGPDLVDADILPERRLRRRRRPAS
jgi:hypothetical protein